MSKATKAKANEKESKKRETKEEKMSEEKSIQKTGTEVSGSLATLTDNNPKFMEVYGKQVERVASTMPTSLTFQKIIDKMSDDVADKICEITKKLGGEMQGMYSNDDRPDFPELRLFHGTGNDPNRPERQVPGEFYLTSKESVGKVFTGTLIAIWEGRTMWGDADSGESVRMPICQSMDRKVGSAYGDCETCPNRPWKDGQPQRCTNDVIAYMLTEDMTDIVKVRFSKTSEPAGKRLIRLLKRDQKLWMRWYTITTEQKTSEKDSSRRWYVMNVEKKSGNDDEIYTPEEIHDFCQNMCTSVEAAFILPSIAQTYRQALANGPVDGSAGGGTGVLSADDADDDDTDYGTMEDMPEDE